MFHVPSKKERESWITREYTDKSVYTGTLDSKNRRNGYGILQYHNKAYYKGFWCKDKFSGLGEYSSAGKCRYEGEFLDGKFHGKGMLRFGNRYCKTIYTGSWKNGKRNGYGFFTYPNGDIFEGDFLDGQRHGRGKARYARGRVYEEDVGYKSHGAAYDGEWLHDKRHGKGVYHFQNGDVYKGDFVSNMMHGSGEYRHARSGDYYIGNSLRLNAIFKMHLFIYFLIRRLSRWSNAR